MPRFKVRAQKPNSPGPGAPVNFAPDPNEWDEVTYVEGSDAWETATDSFDSELVIEINDDPLFDNFEAGDELYTIELLDAPDLGFTQETYILNEGAGSANIELSSSSTITTATFIIRDDDWNNNFANAISLNEIAEADDDFWSATSIRDYSTNVGATKELGEPNHGGNSGGASVWWSWTAPESRNMEVTTQDNDFNTLLGVYTGSSIAGLSEVASNNDSDSESKVTFTAEAGTTYYIAVDGYNNGNSVQTGNVSPLINTLNETFDQYDGPDRLSIPDQSTATSELDVSGLSGTVLDMDVSLDISHSDQKDLDVFLISPAGTRVELLTDVGNFGDGVNPTTLDDQAASSIIEAEVFYVEYRPEGLLSSFNSQDPNGTWTLEITDDAAGDVGILNSWSLTFNAISI